VRNFLSYIEAVSLSINIMKLVDILLPTYNGERFLSAQIDSLLHQTYSNWRLIIRDDLSTDGTLLLINEYKDKYPDRIYVQDSQSVKKGVIASFESLLEASAARYVAFCDQDDVWSPDKLLLQIEKMRELEVIHGDNMPILVHTDLSVVDDQLRLVGESFWRYQHLNPDKMCSLPRLLVQNCVTGCTVLINRPLIVLALPFPQGVIMHDWWMALIAVSEGVVCDMKTSTVKYRQHDSNDTGAKQWGPGFIMKSISRGRDTQLQSLLKTRVQAEALLRKGVLNDMNSQIVKKYISLYDNSWLMRRINMIRMGFIKYGIIRNIAMMLRI
jgi:glycosyltransferase involved in cell wall biosynthesis